jgi:hypothetical protein
MPQSPGAIALTLPQPANPLDEEAFEQLARYAEHEDSALKLDAIDRAFERLIAVPERKTSGKLLAARLIRDGQKFLKDSRCGEILSDDIEAENRSVDPPTPFELYEIREAVFMVRRGLMRLTIRERLVFLTRTLSGPADAVGVRDRQFRSLLSKARKNLWLQHGVEEACAVIMDGLDRWRFETVDLLGPLSECLAVIN